VTPLQQTIDDTVRALGYELVELERSVGGLLRVTIDWPWSPGAHERPITVEDCERATRQLQYALEVAGADYRRLEVASPGIDRPLRQTRDFERFAGALVDVTLKEPVGADVANGLVAANRKKFRGVLGAVDGNDDGGKGRWQIVWRDEPQDKSVKPGRRVSAKKVQNLPPEQALVFTLDELAAARLAPVVSFKATLDKSPRVGAPGVGMGCEAQSAAIPGGIASICNEADHPKPGCDDREGLVQRRLNDRSVEIDAAESSSTMASAGRV
jgi:ribosome maturation factor RimP